jgi:hypothetical protein
MQISSTCAKHTSNSVCTSTVVVSSDPLSLTPSTSSAMKTPEDAKDDPDDPESADEDPMVFIPT